MVPTCWILVCQTNVSTADRNFSVVMTCICDNYFSTISGASTSLLGKRKSMPMLPWCAITFYFNFMSRISDVFIL